MCDSHNLKVREGDILTTLDSRLQQACRRCPPILNRPTNVTMKRRDGALNENIRVGLSPMF